MFFMLLLLSINNVFSQSSAAKLSGNQFADIINQADDFLLKENYLGALNEYERAWNLNPRQKYTEKKIDQIYRTLANTPLLKSLIEKSINLGDSCFMASDFRGANVAYFNALKLDHSAEYPKDQLIAISKLYADPENEARSRILFVRGEKAAASGKYDNAINFYGQALLLKPSDTWLLKKLDETASHKTEYLLGIDQYSKYLNSADLLLELKKWDEASSVYSKAAALQPKQNYPTARIVLIGHLKNVIGQKTQSYQNMVALGDKFFSLQDYENAAIQYQQAENLKPDEMHPKTMLKKIKHVIPKINVQGDEYEAAVTNADILSLAGDDKAALIGFQRCLAFHTDDNYVKSRIRELTNKYAVQTVPDDAYAMAISRGIKSMESTNYTKALSEFRYAATLKPDEKLPKEKISAINSILENQKSPTANTSINNKLIGKPIENQMGSKIVNVTKAKTDSTENIEHKTIVASNNIDEKTKVTNQGKNAETKGFVDNSPIGLREKKQEEYESKIAVADINFSEKDYQKAIVQYSDAIVINPDSEYPKQKISAIESILQRQKAKEELFENEMAAADKAAEEKDFVKAISGYKKALILYPDKTYLQERIRTVNTLVTEAKTAQENYNKAISTAEKAYATKDYKLASESYQSAAMFKPDQSLPKQRIEAINELILNNIKSNDTQYTEIISQADEFYQNQEWLVAKNAYILASALKPNERYPSDKIIEISNLLIAKAKAEKEEYDNAIADATKALKENDLDLAAQLFSTASTLQPKNPYPGQMIAWVRKSKLENSVVIVSNEIFVLKKESERKFHFDPIDYGLRKRNCIIVKARTMDSLQPKLLVSYGKENSKNGGVVLKGIDSRLFSEFAINIGVQDKWFREDNNYLSLYAENGDLEISSIKIAQMK